METKVNKKTVKILGVEPNNQGCVFEFETEVEYAGLKSTKVFAGWDVIVGSVFSAGNKESKNGKKTKKSQD